MDHNSNQKRQKHEFLLLPKDKATGLLGYKTPNEYEEYSRGKGCEKGAINRVVVVKK